jgi:hypothetical protein
MTLLNTGGSECCRQHGRLLRAFCRAVIPTAARFSQSPAPAEPVAFVAAADRRRPSMLLRLTLSAGLRVEMCDDSCAAPAR